MDLQIVWFILVTVLFVGFFFLIGVHVEPRDLLEKCTRRVSFQPRVKSPDNATGS